MRSVTFTVPGPVRGKGRPRTGIVAGHAMIYTDTKTRNYEAEVRAAAANLMLGQPLLVGPLSVRMTARFAPPASTSRRKLARMLGGYERPTTKPDSDNILKVMDALNGVVFRDDAQVCSVALDKIFADKPGLDVTISTIDFAAELEDII
jgi:Holliday junction resolvase RusA-like endonuclease